MKKFHRRRGMIVTQLSAYEVEMDAAGDWLERT
jgi:hypothetical protein